MTSVLWSVFNVIIKLVQRDLFNKCVEFHGVVSCKLKTTLLYYIQKKKNDVQTFKTDVQGALYIGKVIWRFSIVNGNNEEKDIVRLQTAPPGGAAALKKPDCPSRKGYT
jgi:hypothetical protein